MRIGIPREIKNHEYRVGLTPAGVQELVRRGHQVTVESGAGLGSAITDADYLAVGARLDPDADAVWAEAETVVKVKEPVAAEHHRLRADLTLFTYLHLAADRPLTEALLAAGTTAVAYETVQLPDRSLPLLAPMSEVAGRLASQVGAYHLARSLGGRGTLMGGVPGVEPARVTVIGGGVSGLQAARVAVGMGAEVTVLDLDIARLRQIDVIFDGRVRTLASSSYAIEQAALASDLVIGAVLIPGAKAPTLVSNDLVKAMPGGSVLVDIAIDQGGCFEDSRPTTHADPVYAVHDSVFYCVANMPGAMPRTSTYALSNATLPYLLRLADLGWREALTADPALAAGLNTHGGALTSAGVGAALDLAAEPVADVLAAAR